MNDDSTQSEKLLASYRSFQVLDPASRRPICAPVNMSIFAGSVTLVCGANGIGKSSLLHATKDSKRTSVPFLGQILVEPAPGNIFHHPQLAMAQFALPLTLSEIYGWSEDASNLASPLLDGLDLSRPWDSSSGGEKQRVILASLLSHSHIGINKLLLLDEPTNHLDGSSRTLIAKELARWIQADAAHRAAIVVTHDTALFKSEMSCLVHEMAADQ